MDHKAEVLSKATTSALVGLSRATIWRMERADKFPRRIQLSIGRVGYLRKDVESWLAERPHA